MAVTIPIPIPPIKPGAAKNPNGPIIVLPKTATTAPTAAYFAYLTNLRIAYRNTYLKKSALAIRVER